MQIDYVKKYDRQMREYKFNILRLNRGQELRNQVSHPNTFIKLNSPLYRTELSRPIRNTQCSNNPSCIWQLDDLLKVLAYQLHLAVQKGATYIYQYDCGMCRNPLFNQRVMRRLDGLYHDRDLQLCIKIAKQKYLAKFGNEDRVKRRFKDTELYFHKNGKVEFRYKVKNPQNKTKQFQFIEPIMQPSLKKGDQNIYYNTDDFRINKNQAKIAHQFIKKCILDKFRRQFNRMESGQVANIKSALQKFESKLKYLYQSNITLTKREQSPFVAKLIFHHSQFASTQLLAFYPREKTWLLYHLERQNGDKIRTLPSNALALVHQDKVYIISSTLMYIFDLGRNFHRRFKYQELTFERNIALDQQQPTVESRKIVVTVPNQVMADPLKAAVGKVIPNGISYPSLIGFNNFIYSFGGRSEQDKKLYKHIYRYDTRVKNAQWVKLKVELPFGVESATPVCYKQSIFLIGGELDNKKFSKDIIEFFPQNQTLKLIQSAIKIDFNSIYVATNSIKQGKFVLIDLREGTYRNNTYIKIFDAQKKVLKEEYIVEELFRMHSQPKADILAYMTYPSCSVCYEGINYFISWNFENTHKREYQLIYGSDSTWFRSQPHQSLLVRSKN